ncbi:hypothetical protein FRC10_008526 [Ceratobasidium sp. 414]|nr:hypothetical protein FRC10_008526 [Ceratobasidium sp. 414]
MFSVKVWSCVMSERPLSFVPLYGIRHGGNVPLIIQSYSVSNVTATLAQIDLQESDTYRDYDRNTFAYNLDPNPASEPNRTQWPVYGSSKAALQLLSSSVTVIGDTNSTDATDFIINLYG